MLEPARGLEISSADVPQPTKSPVSLRRTEHDGNQSIRMGSRQGTRTKLLAVVATSAALFACSSSEEPAPPTQAALPPAPPPPASNPPGAPPLASEDDPFDVPIDGATDVELKAFFAGDNLFELALRDADGLGPLYTRTSCGACHAAGVRGPGSVQKMAVVLADGVTTDEDQSALPFGHTVHPLYTGGGKTPVLVPAASPANIKVTTRLGPPILGRGYVEAISDAEIERVAAEQGSRSDAIHGRINRVVYASEGSSNAQFHTTKKGDVVIGRFGLKGRIATLDFIEADGIRFSDVVLAEPVE